jgi:hypothetical protein
LNVVKITFGNIYLIHLSCIFETLRVVINESVGSWFSYSIIYYGAPSGHQGKILLSCSIDFEITNVFVIIQVAFFYPLLDWNGVPC